jgi:hypothetical protein
MKKVYVEVTTRLIVQMDEDCSVEEVMENMDYEFNYNDYNADIVDTEIRDYTVTDVK